MSRRVALTNGGFAVVDDEDYSRVSKWRWHSHREGKNIYAVRQVSLGAGKTSTIRLHRFILSAPARVLVDHRNGNGLDCRRSNLRLASQAQNLSNRGPNSNNSSGYKGVSFNKQIGKWTAKIGVNYKTINLGVFETAQDAANAYAVAAHKLHGEFSRTE